MVEAMKYSDFLKEEANRKSAVYTVGRFNPPTFGHENLIRQVYEAAKKMKATGFVFPTHTQDNKKNPLSIDEKMKVLKSSSKYKKLFKKLDRSMANPYGALNWLVENGYNDIHLISGDDRGNEYQRIQQYANKTFGDTVSFNPLSISRQSQKVSGKVVSGSLMRKFAMDDDYDSFRAGLPSWVDRKVGVWVFGLVQDRLGAGVVRESVEFEHGNIVYNDLYDFEGKIIFERADSYSVEVINSRNSYITEGLIRSFDKNDFVYLRS